MYYIYIIIYIYISIIQATVLRSTLLCWTTELDGLWFLKLSDAHLEYLGICWNSLEFFCVLRSFLRCFVVQRSKERTLGSDQTTLRDLSDSLMPRMPKAWDNWRDNWRHQTTIKLSNRSQEFSRYQSNIDSISTFDGAEKAQHNLLRQTWHTSSLMTLVWHLFELGLTLCRRSSIGRIGLPAVAKRGWRPCRQAK
jgi:hypothetical protein